MSRTPRSSTSRRFSTGNRLYTTIVEEHFIMKCSSIVMLFYLKSLRATKASYSATRLFKKNVRKYTNIIKKCHFNRGYSSISTFSENRLFRILANTISLYPLLIVRSRHSLENGSREIEHSHISYANPLPRMPRPRAVA